ncbi:hypothetical protein AVEN_78580-1 [Araneus ventricosus]|uniref:Uncharacterized protein n=1 Tax=Araneus ventricosus TaxID=182803 RepID=A0A4Y2SFY6_ARAVE|nr:hypothetical protein AVEN_78580-1 [Araneus ventricosus]
MMMPERAPSSPSFRATPAGGPLATAYDLACQRPHTRRNRVSTLRSRGQDLATRRQRPPILSFMNFVFLFLTLKGILAFHLKPLIHERFTPRQSNQSKPKPVINVKIGQNCRGVERKVK